MSTVEGAADGVKEGTETDPLKAHAIDLYKAQLDRWFSSSSQFEASSRSTR